MAEKILIIDDDVDTLRLVGMMLQKQGYQILAAVNGLHGIAQAESESPDIILLDVMMPEMEGYEVAKRLRSNPETARIPILMFTAKSQLDDKVTGFESGADDYLTKPTHPTELQAHVRALLARTVKKEKPARTAERRAFTIGLLAARGGFGVSTVAANLGVVLHRASGQEVLVAEMRPGTGTLCQDLRGEDAAALAELLRTPPAQLTRQSIQQAIVSHPCGVKFLFGTSQPTDAALASAVDSFTALAGKLTGMAPILVLDLGSGLPLHTQKIITGCNQVLVIVEPSAPSIRHTRLLIKDLIGLGLDPGQIHGVVVNRVRSELQMNWTQSQENLSHPVITAVTPAPELMYQAARSRTLAVTSQADSLTAQQFSKLGDALLALRPA